MKRAAAGAVLALGLASGALGGQAADPPLSLSKFGLARLRKTVTSQNVVYAAFNIHAAEGSDLRNLKARVEYNDFNGETLAKTRNSKLRDIDGGKKRPVRIACNLVPVFNGYMITISGEANGRRGEWRFFGASGVDQPAYLPPKPIPKTVLLVCMAHELRQPLRARWARLFLRVRNLGSVEAREACCVVEVRGKGGKRLGTAREKLKSPKGGLAGQVKGGEERLFVMNFASFPRYQTYSVSLEWKSPPPEERLAGGEFEGKRDVELAHFAFERQGDTLVITGEARNGLDRPVENLRVTVNLLGDPEPESRDPKIVKTADVVLKGRTEPGKVRPFRIVAKGVKDYRDFEYEIGYEEPGEKPAPVAAGEVAVTIRSAVKKPDGAVEIEGEVANAGAVPVAGIEIVFSFKKDEKTVHSVTHRVPGVVGPRERADFRIVAESPPPFDEYFYEVRYKPAN